MKYPDTCIKGIPNDDFLIEDGSVASHLFYFKQVHKRDDGWIEQSINWNDDDFVVEFTFNQRKENGEVQFKVGLTSIPREGIDNLNEQPTVNGILAYERQPLGDNPYHGNIMIRADVPKPTMKKIAAHLASIVTEVILKQ